MVPQKPREIAARILIRHAGAHAYLEDLVDQEFTKIRLAPADRALVQEICYGCVRWRATLDWLVEQKTRERPTTALKAILGVGLYQILWLDRIPNHAAVHATVDAARVLGLEPQVGVVNAILRTYIREADLTRQQLAALKLAEPALGWSHPDWLVQRWLARRGSEHTQALLAWNNQPAPVFARVNTLKTDAARLIAAWRDEGVDYDFARFDWVPENHVFLLRKTPPLPRLASFTNGGFYIQDPSTLLAVRMLDPKPGEHILDLCAAPGGKSTYLAQLLDNDGIVVATDPDPKRRSRLQENCHRLAADVTVVAPDDPKTHGPFDAILLDAPCSNSGVLRRRIDARWRITPQSVERARDLQRELIADAMRRLRPGGRLVYSTCSLEPEENEDRLHDVLGRHPGFSIIARRQLDPVRDGVDGAFAAVLRRDESTSAR